MKLREEKCEKLEVEVTSLSEDLQQINIQSKQAGKVENNNTNLSRLEYDNSNLGCKTKSYANVLKSYIPKKNRSFMRRIGSQFT